MRKFSILLTAIYFLMSSLLLSDDETHNRFIGKEDAPVVMYEFASLACVHCANFATEIMPQIKSDFVDKGLLKVVFLDVPFGPPANLVSHRLLYKTKNSEDFFKLAGIYFENQNKIYSSKDPIKEVTMYAKLIGIPEKEILDSINNKSQQDKFIKKSENLLRDLKVQGTPTVFIVKKGQPLLANSPNFVGTPSYNALKREIEKALK